jgi:hypothetical protein
MAGKRTASDLEETCVRTAKVGVQLWIVISMAEMKKKPRLRKICSLMEPGINFGPVLSSSPFLCYP